MHTYMGGKGETTDGSAVFEPLEPRLLLSVELPGMDLVSWNISPTPGAIEAESLTMPVASDGIGAPVAPAISPYVPLKGPRQSPSTPTAGPVNGEDQPSTGAAASTGTEYLVWDPEPNYFLQDQWWYTRWWDVTSAPAGATVTSIEYRLWIGEEDAGETDFYCADYIIAMSSGAHGEDWSYFRAWDHDGGRTDGGDDDDTADDHDIYLNRRSTSAFNGEPVNQMWYWHFEDSYAGDDGNINYVEFWIHYQYEEAHADLTPYKPSNWDDKIPIGITQLAWDDTHSYSGPYYSDQALYFNWGSDNIGDVTASNYTVHFEVTGTGGGTWDWTNITTDPGYWTHLTNDQATGPLSAGSHTFKLWVDYTDVVDEGLNEGNNYYERTITVVEEEYADLTPYKPGYWDDKIPIGITQLAGGDPHSYSGPYYSDQALYFNWGSDNIGDVTASNYTVHFEVTGTGGGTWDWTNITTDPGYWTHLTNDQATGPLSSGSHTFKLWVDYTDVVDEGLNEGNNYYERTITVEAPVNTPPVIIGLPDRELDEDGHLSQGAGYVTHDRDTFDLLWYDGDGISEGVAYDEETSRFRGSDDEGRFEYLGFDGDLPGLEDSPDTGTRYRIFDEWPGDWTDAEKDTQPGDDLMCWAGTAANMLEWTGWGNAGGMVNSDDMFQHYIDHWTDVGSLTWVGHQYWFDGTNAMEGVPGWSQIDVPGGGNFYPSLLPGDYIHTRGQGAVAKQMAMVDVDQYSRAGYGVGLGLFGSLGHAVTSWGFNYDPGLDPGDPDYYLGVWISDSDDDKYTPDGHTAPDVLHYYAVTWDSGNNRYNFDAYYPGAYIGEVDGLERQTADSYDLWDYVSDAQTPDSGLTLAITANTNPDCGAQIVSGHYLEITPTPDWNGTSDVTIRVTDPEGLWAEDTFRVTVNSVNDAPVIASLSDNPDPVIQGNTLTLTTNGVSDDHGVASVSFYRDANGNGVGDAGELLGTDTSAAGGWTWSGAATWAVGPHTYLARATDDGVPAPVMHSTWVSTPGVVDWSIPEVAYEIVLTDMGGTELARDGSGNYIVAPGQEFIAEVWVDDLRDVGASGGVFAAYADLCHDNSSCMTWVAGTVAVDSFFANAQDGSIVEPCVDEAGGFDGFTPPGADPAQLLFTVHGQIDLTCPDSTIITLSLDPADESPSHDTLVFGESNPVGATYETETLHVVQCSWTNSPEPRDVNDNGTVEPLDALIIINELNNPTMPHVPLPTPPCPPPYFYDVNGDGSLSPVDALIIINYLNSQQGAMLDSSDRDVKLAMAETSSVEVTVTSESAKAICLIQRVAPAADSSGDPQAEDLPALPVETGGMMMTGGSSGGSSGGEARGPTIATMPQPAVAKGVSRAVGRSFVLEDRFDLLGSAVQPLTAAKADDTTVTSDEKANGSINARQLIASLPSIQPLTQAAADVEDFLLRVPARAGGEDVSSGARWGYGHRSGSDADLADPLVDVLAASELTVPLTG